LCGNCSRNAPRITEDQLEAHAGVRGQSAGRAPAANLTPIVELIASQKLTPAVPATFPLDLAAAPRELCETGRGRIILHLAD
jgi:NADPH:quinone reductase-like Zn-dependent oxidoreductase